MYQRGGLLFVLVGVAAAALVGFGAPLAMGQLHLGFQELVKDDGVGIDVPGYSVPSLVDWDSDGLPDLIVGEGSGSYAAMVRVYLNVGTACAPEFSGYVFAQSDGSDLVLTGGG